eukprot:TRINITY_DN1460_c0_g1_i1.p1 TRINITY_DN1460_c0_g1~~TRINITY_DN1460_c0_g1_i1.p1  ORF type:complete len:346 (+),score=73.37 TRINITY_DN1460_c0_g1_i1:105-1142(+)
MLSQMSDTMMGLGQLTNEPRRILNKVLHTTRSMLLARTGAGQKPKSSATASSTQGRKTAKDMGCEKSKSQDKDKDSMDCHSHLSSSISLSASMSETEYACDFECGCEDSTEDVKPQNEASQQGDKAISNADVDDDDDDDSQPMLLASLCGAEADKDIAMMFGLASMPIHAASVDAALQRLVRPCDADLAGAPRDGCGDGLAFVKSAACPDIARYMEGIRRYKICGDAEYLMAMGLTLRALDALNTLNTLNTLNASSSALVFANADALRRLFLTSIAIACKYHHDNPFNSYSFGFLMGISARDMNALEAELLRILDFNATPSLPHLHSAVQLLSAPSLRPRSSSAN